MTYALRSVLLIAIAMSGVFPASGAFHLWQVKEAFTNADGSVQFIELFDSNPGETAVGSKVLRSNSDGVINNFTIPSNLSGTTTNHHMLIATSSFSSQSGSVTPDYGTLPTQFFNPNATNITITFVASNDSISFTGASLPKNGFNSLTDANAFGTVPNNATSISMTVNSPTDFAVAPGGTGGQIDLRGDFNVDGIVSAADYAKWRKANLNGAQGYTDWRTFFGRGTTGGANAAIGVPEPMTAAAFLAASAAFIALRRRRHASVPC